MAKITRTLVHELKETGAGISKADEIDMTRDNWFTNKWGESTLQFKVNIAQCAHQCNRTVQQDSPVVLRHARFDCPSP